MSGIAGILRRGDTPIDPAWTRRLADQLQHRGPDGGGVWADDQASLAGFLLAVTPESRYEHQPWHYHHWVIVADSRLDNRAELLRALRLPASESARIPDSQLILRAFAHWGEDCVHHLLGDFAFAIWDRVERRLFCATDPAGIKPFLFFYDEKYFAFASELRALLCLPFVPRALNEEKFREFLLGFLSFDKSGETLWRGIYRLRPGQQARIAEGAVTVGAYWRAEPGPRLKLPADEDYAEALRELVRQAVEDRLRSDAPVGMLLSGGLDSSSIAGVAAPFLRQKGEQLYAASSVLPVDHPGIEEDERPYLEAVLEREPNIDIHYVTAAGAGPFDGIERIFQHTGVPVNNFFYLDNALLASLQQRGVRRILSGFAGDGTVSYHGRNVPAHLAREFRFGALAALLHQRRQVDGISRKQALQQKVVRPLLRSAWGGRHRGNDHPGVRALLASSAVNEAFAVQVDLGRLLDEVEHTFQHPTNVHRSIWNESLLWIREEEFVMQAHAKLEMAFPFLDKRIIDFLLSLPPGQFLHKGWKRGLIRAAMDGILPPKVQWRKDKTLFSPDFYRRLLAARPALVQLLEASAGNPLLNYYLDLDKIKGELYRIRIPRNWREMDKRSLSVVGLGVMALKYLQFLESNSIFEGGENCTNGPFFSP